MKKENECPQVVSKLFPGNFILHMGANNKNCPCTEFDYNSTIN
jgi:hypothetical protein